MTEQTDRQQEHADEITRHNVEEARKLLAAKEAKHGARSADGTPRYEDPLHEDQSVIPNQNNVPAGATTGSLIRQGRRRTG